MKKLILSICFIASFAMLAQAQIKTPAASPFCKMTQEVGLAEITIEYSRPSVKDRDIFSAEGLVPYGKLWRTGANAATKITVSEDIKLGGKEVAKGSYAMLSKPTSSTWTFHLYPYESGSWSSYAEQTPAVVFDVASAQMPMSVESMMIIIDDLRDAGATLNILWDKTFVSIPIEAEVDSKVEDAIAATMGGPSRGEYYTAATYYFNQGKDMNKALEWIKKANEKEPKFWQLRRESQILANLGRYPEAITAAEKSMKMAEEAGNDEYVKFNKTAIAEWAKMKGKKMLKKSK